MNTGTKIGVGAGGVITAIVMAYLATGGFINDVAYCRLDGTVVANGVISSSDASLISVSDGVLECKNNNLKAAWTVCDDNDEVCLKSKPAVCYTVMVYQNGEMWCV